MQFKDYKFIYISLDYLREMHKVDSEVFFMDDPSYEKKPHLGILITENGREYVIPLTSAKKKHAQWDDVTATNYRIYEIINIEKVDLNISDIIVDIKNTEILKGKNILPEDYLKYRKRILSVLEIKKMFPIVKGAYTYADLDLIEGLEEEERKRRNLMQKEYEFCVGIREAVKVKASKIYEKQMKTGKVLKFYCDFKKLEAASDAYKAKTNDEEK